MDELDEFFQGRTIGYTKELGWTWREPGYDEWSTPTPEEIQTLRKILDRRVIAQWRPEEGD